LPRWAFPLYRLSVLICQINEAKVRNVTLLAA